MRTGISASRPNFFIIGAPKCGTSALAKYLSEHRQVYFSVPKEPFYWCFDFPKLAHEIGLSSLDDYLKLFSDAKEDQIAVGEGSTRYLRSEVAVKEIMNFNPASKFIIMIRNPIEVVQAYHMEQYYSCHESEKDFTVAWALQETRARGSHIPRGCREPKFLQYKEVVSFAEQIQRVYDNVPKDQVELVLFDDFKADARRVYQNVCRFIGVEQDGRTSFERVNSAHAHRYQWIAKLVLTPPAPLEKFVLRIRRRFWGQNSGLIPWIKSKLNRPIDGRVLPAEFMEQLQSELAPEIDKLETLVGRDLNEWRVSRR